jgi:uncharacterized protein
MGRLLVLVLLVVLAVWLVRRALRRPDAAQKPAVESADLVRCAHCGVHLPRAESRERAGELYCSEDHARLGKR